MAEQNREKIFSPEEDQIVVFTTNVAETGYLFLKCKNNSKAQESQFQM